MNGLRVWRREDVQGKRVLLRVDLNVPLEETEEISVKSVRIASALRSIRALQTAGARTVGRTPRPVKDDSVVRFKRNSRW